MSFCLGAGAHLSHKILVLNHAQVPACGLGDPLPRHQVSDHHRSRADAHYRKSVRSMNWKELDHTALVCSVRCVSPTGLLLARFGQVGDACVRTHEDVAGVKAAVQEGLLGI